MAEEHRLHISNFPFWFGRRDIAFALQERFARPSRITPLRVGPYDVRFRRMSAFVHWNNDHGFPPPELVTGWLPQAMWHNGWTVPLVAEHVRPPAPKGKGTGKQKGSQAAKKFWCKLNFEAGMCRGILLQNVWNKKSI